MIHWITNLFLKPVLHVFFRHVKFEGLENLPKDKPILLCANHPNSFLDGIVLSAFLKPETYVFVRGDVFKKKLANAYFRKLYLIPIFRSRDASAREALKANNQTYDECFALFQKGKRILIFPEAISRSEWQLRPLKKGAARIYLDMMERDPNLDLCMVPLGFNYSFFKGLRKDVLVKFQKPYFKEDLFPNDTLAVQTKNITEVLQKDIASSMVLEFEEQPDLLRLGLDTIREEQRTSPWKTTVKDFEDFNSEKAVSEGFNKNPEKTIALAKSYHKELQTAQLENFGYYGNRTLDWLLFFLLVVPSTLVWSIWYPCHYLGKYLADKLVKQDHFYDSIRVGGFMASSMIWTLLWATLVGVFVYWPLALVVFLVPHLMKYHQVCKEVWKRGWAHAKWKKAGSRSEALIESRKAFLSALAPEE